MTVTKRTNQTLSRLMSDYGMLLILLLLCVFYSLVTLDRQHPSGVSGAKQVARQIGRSFGKKSTVLVVTRGIKDDQAFAEALEQRLSEAGLSVLAVVRGNPLDARRAVERIVEQGKTIDVIACNRATARWAVFDRLAGEFPTLADLKVVSPRSYVWPNFLKADNLVNVANQIVVIAIIAIGMTMVIITAGIDLSVGSLIALSAVVSTLLIREAAGAEQARAVGMILCCVVGILAGAAMGLFSGTMVSVFRIPPFIVTLAMMMVASGLAYIFAQGESVYEVPQSFTWLGRGLITNPLASRLLTAAVIMAITYLGVYLISLTVSLFVRPLGTWVRMVSAAASLVAAVIGLLIRPWAVPVAILLMVILYAIAHVVMTRTIVGRYVYAVGGNREAARLSGVPVKTVLLFVYTVCGALAGLGGIVMASQLKSGSPTYGGMYELYVIAAVVVGGTSLSGGEGKVLGTLIGAFIIAVIQNGMNLTEVESYTQKVVLGVVILAAVLLDMLKKRGVKLFRRR